MTNQYCAYGDESCFKDLATYAIVVVKKTNLESVINRINLVKTEFGLNIEDFIHCKEILNPSARKKTNYRILNDKQAEQFILSVITKIKDTVISSVGIYNDRYFKNVGYREEGTDRTFFPSKLKDKKKMWQMLAFQAASPIIDKKFGTANTKLWIDYDHTVVDHFGLGQKKQQYRSYNFFSLEKKTTFMPEPKPNNKPDLLQIADVLAYSAAHSFYSKFCYRKLFFRKIVGLFNPDTSKIYPKLGGPSIMTFEYKDSRS